MNSQTTKETGVRSVIKAWHGRTTHPPSFLAGGVQLTLRMVVEQEIAFGEPLFEVPLKSSEASKRRRRERPEEGWTAENESRDIDPVDLRLSRVVTRIMRRVHGAVQRSDDLTYEILADRVPGFNQISSGGKNAEMQTLVALEDALGTPLLKLLNPDVPLPYVNVAEAVFPVADVISKEAANKLGCKCFARFCWHHSRSRCAKFTFTGFEEVPMEIIKKHTKRVIRREIHRSRDGGMKETHVWAIV